VSFCVWCGQGDDRCDGTGTCRRELDPPRFCPDCGRRLTVYVTPGTFSARCRDHGEPRNLSDR